MSDARVRAAPTAQRDAILFVLFASAAFATSSPLARAARPTHPLVVGAARCALAACVLVALDARGIASRVARLSTRSLAAVLGVGVLLAAHFGLFLWGLDTTSLPAAVSLVSLEPLSVLLCAWAFHGLRPTRVEQIGVVTATAGALLVARGAGSGEHRLLGDLVVFAAVLLYGAYVELARGLKDVLPPRDYAALVYASAAITLALAAAIAVPSREVALPGTRSLLAIVALALIPTVLGHTAVQTAARRLPPSIVALVSPGETLGGVAIGAAFLGAIPSTDEILGAVVIVAGATIAVLGGRSALSRPSSDAP
jgi:drug/metabolite transporter (DMT)-like permease